MSGYFGTAYGLPPKVWKLGREALALIECDKIDEQDSERERAMSECVNCYFGDSTPAKHDIVGIGFKCCYCNECERECESEL